MIFGVATNEDQRQRSDKPKQRSPADLIYKLMKADIKRQVYYQRSFIIQGTLCLPQSLATGYWILTTGHLILYVEK